MKNRRKLFKNDLGITLVALIVTIIISLILAGISISSLTNSGIFEKAKEATQKYSNEQDKEKAKIEEYSDKIDLITGARSLSMEEVEAKLKNLENKVKELELQNTVLQSISADNIEIITGTLTYNFPNNEEWKNQTIDLSGHGKGIAIITAYSSADTTSATTWGLKVDGISDFSMGNSLQYRCSSATAFRNYEEGQTVTIGLYSSTSCSNKTVQYRIMFIPQSNSQSN